jgi:hypothetical protein
MSDQTPTRIGRPPYQATDHDRLVVEAMASRGLSQEQIAQAIGCCDKTLRARYREELDRGMTIAQVAVARNLFELATSARKPGNVRAAIFWLKCRAGWRERDADSVSGE